MKSIDNGPWQNLRGLSIAKVVGESYLIPMIPILSAKQIRACDEYTIENGSITSLELMERASISFTNKFRQLFGDTNRVLVVAGVGNNGGDALAIARLLRNKHYKVRVYIVGDLEKGSPDFKANLKRFTDHVHQIESPESFPQAERRDIIVDGIFGSGLSRPVTGLIADLINHINNSVAQVVSVDIASGLFADNFEEGGAIIEPDVTLTFQLPKLAFFQPSLEKHVGDWHVIPVGLDQNFIREQETNYYLMEDEDVRWLPNKRKRFSHKGEFGRLQLVSGGKGKTGAAVIAGRSAFRSGIGLLFSQVPNCAVDLLHHRLIEGMTVESDDEDFISEIRLESQINCIGIGPGISTTDATRNALKKFLQSKPEIPIVLDADGINILGLDKGLIDLLPPQTILTPHPGEFRRLVGEWQNDFEKLDILRELCKKHHLNIVLKGAFSVICNAEGKVIFNNTGNPGMSTAGSGDVLFGMVGSLVAQGIEPDKALLLGVHVHGAAGDVAAEKFGERSVMASDIIDSIPKAFQELGD